MFPPGWPGLALLVLRAGVALALLQDTYSHRQGLPGWLEAAAVFIAVLVAMGYLTPIVAVTSLAVHGGIWFVLGADDTACAVVFALDATALALLGPGAYSIDSYRFGRRLVVLPPA